MIQTFQTVSDDEIARADAQSLQCLGSLCVFYSGSSTQVPMRYLYRGGLEQTGAYSSLTALERARESEGERERKKERENTKPIKQWSTVFDVSRLLIGEPGHAVCKLKRYGQLNALETRREGRGGQRSPVKSKSGVIFCK